MAIPNWQSKHGHGLLALLLCVWITIDAPAVDAPPASLAPKYVALADRRLATAREAAAAAPEDAELAWRLGRALFFRGEFAVGDDRERLAEEGIAVCERGLAKVPESAELHYYLALNQGQLAREKLFGALGLVRQMRDHLLAAAKAKASLDHAGPDRCLALLFRDAPGWPISVGNNKEARRHLNKCYLLAPEYPENLLVLLESWIEWGETEALKEKLKAGASVLEKARKQLTGEEWEPYHADWAGRWNAFKKRAAKSLAD